MTIRARSTRLLLTCAIATALLATGTSAASRTRPSAAAAQVHTTAAMPPAVSAQLPAWMREARVPGVAIAKIERGQLAWTATFGERSPGVAMTADTVFNVASLTKPVFALMALHLVADGALDLDAPLIADWVDPDIAQDPHRHALTARLALSHQTGFQNWRGKQKLAFAFAPGTRHEYSGEGYEYLRLALEQRTGKSLPTLMEATVLHDVTMPRTWFGWNAAAQDHIASGYSASGKPHDMAYLRDRTPSAASSLMTTIGDYGRFAAWVARGADLPRGLFKQMQQPQLAGNSAEHFGLGWRLLRMGKQTVLSHDGRENGVRTQVFVLPATGDGLVILTNSENGEALTRPITTAILSKGASLMAAMDASVWRYLRGMPQDQLSGIAGVIVRSPEFMGKWLHAVDAAVIQPSALTAADKQQARTAIRPFLQAMLDERVDASQAKTLVELILVPGTKAPTWRDRLTPEQGKQWLHALQARTPVSETGQTTATVVVADAQLARYAGEYLLPSNQLRIQIRKTASGLEATAKDMPVFTLFPLSQTLFGFKEGDTRFDFVTDASGAPTGVRVIWSPSRSEVATRIK